MTILPEITESQDDQAKLHNSQAGHGRIGIITNEFSSSYYGQMVQGACNYLMAHGYQTIVQSNFCSHKGELLAWSSLNELDCDGLIIHSNALTDAELHEIFKRYNNTILLNRNLENYESRCVYTDNLIGGSLAARCLIDHGHENIAMISGPKRFHEVNQRAQGFIKELKENDRDVKITVEGDFQQPSGEACIEQILDAGLDITAVFAHNDNMAFGAMNRCRLRDIKIPEDLTIIGYDGLAMCEYVSPKLTSVQQPLYTLGDRAARLMVRLLTDDKSRAKVNSKSNTYTPVLAERESVAPPKGYSNEKVALTHRETECLTWTARGKTAWEISVILDISESTSTFHLRNAVLKFKASNRTHAVAKALHNGLISLE